MLSNNEGLANSNVVVALQLHVFLLWISWTWKVRDRPQH